MENNGKLKLEIAFQDGVNVEVKNDRIIFNIDLDATKRDLWLTQFEMWLTNEKDNNTLSSGYLRVKNNKKLEYKKWR